MTNFQVMPPSKGESGDYFWRGVTGGFGGLEKSPNREGSGVSPPSVFCRVVNLKCVLSLESIKIALKLKSNTVFTKASKNV